MVFIDVCETILATKPALGWRSRVGDNVNDSGIDEILALWTNVGVSGLKEGRQFTASQVSAYRRVVCSDVIIRAERCVGANT